MDCKDLRWVESFAEHVDGTELSAEHAVSVRCLRGAQETFVKALGWTEKEKKKKNQTKDFNEFEVKVREKI